MAESRSLTNALRNKTVRELESALRRDGFALVRQTRTGGRFYINRSNGRTTVIHYHRASDTLPRGTLAAVLAATGWTEEDAKRLGLL